LAFVALWCFVLLAAALQGAWPRVLGLAAHPPDPWIVLVVYVALRGRGYAAVGWALVFGVLRDALSLDPLGTHAFVLATTAFVFCEGHRQRAPVEGLPRLLVTFAAVLLAGGLYLVRIVPMGGSVVWADVLGLAPTALWTTLLGAGLYPILDTTRVFDDLMGRRRGLPA